MSFGSVILAVAGRVLSDRTFELIVVPAVADLQFEPGERRLRRCANRFAVLRAVAGGLIDDVARNSGGVLALALVPACYYIFLMVMYIDFSATSISTSFFAFAAVIAVLSLGPVLVCFVPARHSARSAD